MSRPNPSASDSPCGLSASLDAGSVLCQAVLNGILDAVVIIDDHGRILSTSLSVFDMFGWTRDELLGRSITLLMPEPHRSHHDQYMAHYRETGETEILGQTREFRVLHKDGHVFDAELSVSLVDALPDGGQAFVGSFRDVTARKRQAATEAQLAAIVTGSEHAILSEDLEGRITSWNHAAERMFGWQRDEILGQPFSVLVPEDAAEQDARIRARLRGGETFDHVEKRMLCRDGTPMITSFSASPVRDRDGKLVGVAAICRDITEERAAERVETSTLRSLAAIGESASILAHEIKNPVTAVNLALRAVADTIGEDHASVLGELVGRMRRLELQMRQTLAFARPLDLKVKRTSLVAVLNEVVDAQRPVLERSGVSVEVELPDGLPRVMLDPIRLGEVITNLLVNSCEALGEHGGTRVRISARALGRQVLLTFEDDGPGVSESVRDTIFRPYVTSKHDGTGLGLPICRRIVEESGGSMELAPPGALGGARFQLLLPTMRPESPEEDGHDDG